MSKAHEAVKGVSYLSGGKWRVAAAGDLIEIDEEQVRGATERGVIKATRSPSGVAASATPRVADVPK